MLAAGHADDVPRFWAAVLTAEFACYGMLPWIPTRPPRSLEQPAGPPLPASQVRRLNLDIATRASIQVNTLPSGHAAGAVATALCVASTVPQAAGVFAAIAASITVATVIGRYHYLVDSALGVLVGTAAWALVF
jgi:membrane-associated phospholipid phosphatase